MIKTISRLNMYIQASIGVGNGGPGGHVAPIIYYLCIKQSTTAFNVTS